MECSTFGIRNLLRWIPESRTWNLETAMWSPVSKTFTDNLTRGEMDNIAVRHESNIRSSAPQSKKMLFVNDIHKAGYVSYGGL